MHRILFHIPTPFGDAIPVYSYGFMLMLAFVSGVYLAHRRGQRAGIPSEVILDIGLYAVVAGIIGARLAFLMSPEYHGDSQHPLLDLVSIWKGGLTFQGGLILALIVCLWYLHSRKIALGKMADIFAPSLALGIGIGRVGCYLNGCCWGQIASHGYPLGVCFPTHPVASAPVRHHFALWYNGNLIDRLLARGHDELAPAVNAACDHYLRSGSAATWRPRVLGYIPVHPTQLYTTAAMVLIFVLLLWIERRKRVFDGMVMLSFLMLYSVFRFLIEFIRDDTRLYDMLGLLPPMRLGQILAVVTFIAAGALFLYLYRRAQATPTPDADPPGTP